MTAVRHAARRCALRGWILMMVALGLAPTAGVLALPAEAQVKNEWIKTLAPAAPLTRALRKRIVVEAGKEGEIVDNKGLPRAFLKNEFEPGSVRLTPVGRQQLDQLGAALDDPSLKDSRFLIVGRMSGMGSDVAEQELSLRQATAVKTYLVETSRIDGARLFVVGFGGTRPLVAGTPLDPQNRAFEIINLLP